MAKVAVVYHSSWGHTKAQAEHVVKGLQSLSGISVQLVTADEAMRDFRPLNEADCIVFGCPTYMGSASAKFKEFIDAASRVWAEQGWKDKLAAGFTNSSGPSGDKLSTLMELVVNAMQHSMIWIGTGLMPGAGGTAGNEEEINRLVSFVGAMAQSPQGSTQPLKADLKTAEEFGKRIGRIAQRWVGEKTT